MSEHLLSHPMNPNQAMADSLGEQLSALMDGELARDQVRFLLRGVEAQSDLARRWSSYHVISASLRREYVAVALPANFADGVIGRLDADVATGAPRTSRRIGFGALRWAGGGAIAAAVAVVALTVSRPIEQRAGVAPAVAAADRVPSSQQPYLPIAQPSPNMAFDYNAVQPASFELPNYYLPNGTALPRSTLETYRGPYLLRVQPGPAQGGVQPDALQTRQ